MPYFEDSQEVDVEMDISIEDFCKECDESELIELIDYAKERLQSKYKRGVSVSGSLEDEYKELICNKAKNTYSLKELEEKLNITRY